MYDFAYLLKVLTFGQLPREFSSFVKLLDTYFPQRCDLKLLLDSPASLNILGEDFGVARVGKAHQAGSDALLTAGIYSRLVRELRIRAFDDPLWHHHGQLYGLT